MDYIRYLMIEETIKVKLQMSFLKKLLGSATKRVVNGVISYGKNKADGSHDHRYNIGSDRTPAQQSGDKKRRK